jgi:Ca2+/Na+ antiporter
MNIFPEAEGFGQELFLLIIYCYFIFTGSKAIAEGCDILRDVFGSGIVGGLILPVLGAFPDGIIIVFSLTGGHDSPEAVAEAIAVGIGSLIGATTLLLTLPLCASVFLGSRQLDENGIAMSEYKPIAKGSTKLVLRPVPPKEFSLWNNGVSTLPTTPRSVVWMLITSCTYLFVEIPAIFYHSDADQGAKHEQIFLLFGFVAAAILFILYMKAMASDSDNDNLVEERRQRGNRFLAWTRENRSLISSLDPVTLFNLLDSDRDGFLDAEDIQTGFRLLGFTDISNADALAIFNLADQDNNILIDIDEWTAFVREFILLNEQQPMRGRREKELQLLSDQNDLRTSQIAPPLGQSTSSLNSPTHQQQQQQQYGNPFLGESGFQRDNLFLSTPDSTNNSGNIQMPLRPSVGMKGHALNAAGGESYASPSYVEETNRIWFHNTPKQTSDLDNIETIDGNVPIIKSSKALDASQPLLSPADFPPTPTKYSGIAVSYRGSSTNLPGLNISSVSFRGGINQSPTAINQNLFEKPKFIRLESQSLLPSSSTLPNSTSSISLANSIQLTQHRHLSPQTHLNSQTNLFIDANNLNSNVVEKTEILYIDESRVEEPIDSTVKQTPPSIPPELMTAILKWYLDPTNKSVGLLYIGNKLRWSVHLWAKRTRKLGHYSFTIDTTGERIMKLVKLDPSSQLPVHTRKRTYSNAAHTMEGHVALELGDNMTQRSRAPYGATPSLHHQPGTRPHHNTFFDSHSAVYYQNEWEDLNLPRWCYASPRIKTWYLEQIAKKGTNDGGPKSVSSDSETLTDFSSPETPISDIIGQRSDEHPEIQLISRRKVEFASSSSSSSSSSPSPTSPLSTGSKSPAPIREIVGEMPLLLQLFQFADIHDHRSLTIAEIHQFAQDWGLYQEDITPNVVKVIFYNIDIDYDRSLNIFNFRTLLEEFVKIPQIGSKLLKKSVGSSKRNTPGRTYTEKEREEWVEDVEDHNDDLNQDEQRSLEHFCFCNHMQEYLGDLDNKLHEHNADDDDNDKNKGLTPLEIMERTKRMHTFAGFGYLLLGVALILLFSDPLIEIVTKLGKSSGIPSFYLSFVILPLVSNSAEVITSLMFAKECTTTSISLTLSSLYGAAILNNTFNTGIFFFLLWLKKLPWVYSAEVIVVMSVQVVVGLITFRNHFRQFHAVLCALVFPAAVGAIWIIENVFGLKDW